MTERQDIEARLSAWIDGELAPEEAREVEERLAADPALAEEARALKATGAALRRTADAWEDRVDFAGFWDGVADRLGPEAAPAPEPAWRRTWGTVAGWARHHRPALAAAAATLLVVVGGGSAWLLGMGHEAPDLRLTGGPAVIEDLNIENASAVVYRTQQDVTVIWVTEEEGA